MPAKLREPVRPNCTSRPAARVRWLASLFSISATAAILATVATVGMAEPPAAMAQPPAEPPPAAASGGAAAGAPAGVPAAPIPVAVLPLGLTAQTQQRYPQLAERDVGLGVHNMLVDALYDPHWFRFVEEKQEVVDDLVHRQWESSTGMVSQESAVRYGRLLGARYTLYGEVYDFSSRQAAAGQAETRISIQIRLIDVETSEYVPASGTGTVARPTDPLLKGDKGDNVAFARSTVGEATQAALANAVRQLRERMVREGWTGEKKP
jgi:curli biogenesis system outer membrane secretion channel CsgG